MTNNFRGYFFCRTLYTTHIRSLQSPATTSARVMNVNWTMLRRSQQSVDVAADDGDVASNGRLVDVFSCQVVPTRAHVIAVTGTVGVVPASRWVFVSGHHTLTRSVCPAVSSPVTRSSMSAAGNQQHSATKSLPTARRHHPLSPFNLHACSFLTRLVLLLYQRQLTHFTTSSPWQSVAAGPDS